MALETTTQVLVDTKEKFLLGMSFIPGGIGQKNSEKVLQVIKN